MRREGERVYLTTEEALGVMDWTGDRVHTFRAGADGPARATHDAGLYRDAGGA